MAGTAGVIWTSTLALGLRKTLDGIVDDTTDQMDSNQVARQYMRVESMDSAYEDYTSFAGPAYASEKPEGTDIAVGTMDMGPVLRIFARTFALRMLITEEALEDNKYPQLVRLAKMCKRAIYNTRNLDATSILVNAWDTNYVGADGLPLCSASHTLPGGGTYSNTLSVPMSPSVQALIVVKSAIRKLPALDGSPQQNLMPKKVVCPVEQESVWQEIMGSKMRPDAGNFAAINVTNRWQMEDTFANVYWDNTTTNWGVTTNADDPILFKDRRAPRGKSWVDEEKGIMSFSCSDRHGMGWPDPRAFFGSQA